MRKNKKIISIALRYLILLIIGFLLSLVYQLFLPATYYSSYFLLKIFYNVSLSCNNIILLNGLKIEIVKACVALSAYYLLLILNLTTPMTKKQRTYSLIFSILSLFILNILRIFFLSILYSNGANTQIFFIVYYGMFFQ